MVTRPSLVNLIISVILMVITSQSLLASPISRIDRSVIALDDTLTLTIRVNESGSIDAPDLSPLATDFHVLGNSQSSRHTIRNGASESWTEWAITLMPKRKGQLTIPALAVNREFSQPININVQPKVPVSVNNLKPVYLESEVDWDSVYVQQQVIYTLRIFQSIQLDNMNISEPSFDNAAVEKISQNSFQRRVHNTPYRVHELRYAIFPQQTGELIIPELVFTASETIKRRSVFNLPGQGRTIRKISPQHKIIVKTPPTQMDGNDWLPAKSVRLTETWSSSIDDIRVGDSITRTVTLNAEGLIDSQLSPMQFTNIEGAKLYPDQGNSETSSSDQGVVSFRANSVALIPTREGNLTLPAISVRWWDTQHQIIKEATIPTRTIRVKPALAGAISNSTPLAIDHSQPLNNGVTSTVIKTNDSSLWQLLSAVLTVAWLLTLYLWWRSKRLRIKTIEKTDDNNPLLSEKKAFRQLSQSCKNNDPHTIRASLITWASAYWPQHCIQSLQDIQQICPQMDLLSALQELDKLLYGAGNNDLNPSGQPWKGENLLSILTLLRQNKGSNENPSKHLTPLY